MEQHEFEIDPEILRLAMRQWATGVTIVTSLYQGEMHGMTVSSFTSISLIPPLILVSLELNSRTYELVRQSGVFAVTILADYQEEISDRFAGRETERLNRFEGLETFTLATGAPLLANGLACFDCLVVSEYEAGDHMIFIGDVIAAQTGQEHPPLIYYDRDYRELCD